MKCYACHKSGVHLDYVPMADIWLCVDCQVKNEGVF